MRTAGVTDWIDDETDDSAFGLSVEALTPFAVGRFSGWAAISFFETTHFNIAFPFGRLITTPLRNALSGTKFSGMLMGLDTRTRFVL